MKHIRLAAVLFLLMQICLFEAIASGQAIAGSQPDLLSEELSEDGENGRDEVADPLEPVNRAVFVFNDKLYFWVLKPVKTGYIAVVPKDIRVCLGNFVSNLATPVVLLNTLLQGRWEDAGVVLSRFGVNTVLGVYGFADPANSEFGLKPRSADFGQTLGVYGAGEGVYLYWPVFGPSNIRDTFGLVADNVSHPLSYLNLDSAEIVAFSAGSFVNRLSLGSNEYEEMKKYSLDPYVSVREAYHEYRNARIEGKRSNNSGKPSPAESDLLPGIETQL